MGIPVQPVSKSMVCNTGDPGLEHAGFAADDDDAERLRGEAPGAVEPTV